MENADTAFEQMGNTLQEQPFSRKRRADESASYLNQRMPSDQPSKKQMLCFCPRLQKQTSNVKPATWQVTRNRNRCVPLVPTPTMCEIFLVFIVVSVFVF